jgi:hypothetical protein
MIIKINIYIIDIKMREKIFFYFQTSLILGDFLVSILNCSLILS